MVLGGEALERTTTRDRVVNVLRWQILGGQLLPGTPIREKDVSDALGVSRGPVREALIHLAGEGLVAPESYRGHTVIDPEPRDVREMFSMRSALEGMAAERAALNADPAELTRLRDIVEQMKVASDAHDRSHYAQCDISFHETVLRMADHQLLLRTWLQIRNRFVLLANISIARLYEDSEALDKLADRHMALYLPIERGETEEARRLAALHPLAALERYEREYGLGEGKVSP